MEEKGISCETAAQVKIEKVDVGCLCRWILRNRQILYILIVVLFRGQELGNRRFYRLLSNGCGTSLRPFFFYHKISARGFVFFDDLFGKVKSSWEWFRDLKLNPKGFLAEI